MRPISPATLNLQLVSGGAAASFGTVSEVLAASEAARAAVADLVVDVMGNEPSDDIADLLFHHHNLFFGEPVTVPADGMLKIILYPAQWYLEFVTLVARAASVACSFDLHGWPILAMQPERIAPCTSSH